MFSAPPENPLTDSRLRLDQLIGKWFPWVYTVLLSLILSLIFSINVFDLTAPDLQVGQRADADIVAEQGKSYVSALLTQRARETARDEIDDVFTLMDRNIGRTQDGYAREVFDFIGVVRADQAATLEQKLEMLLAVEGVVITPEVASTLLSMTDTQFTNVRTEISRIIGRLMSSEIRNDGSYDSADRVSRELGFGLNEAQEAVVMSLAPQFIVPNRFLDAVETDRLRSEAYSNVNSITKSIAKGEVVVENGQEIRPEHIEILEQLGILQAATNWWEFGTITLISFLSVTVCTLYWFQFSIPEYHKRRYVILLTSLTIIFAILAAIMLSQQEIIRLLFPAAALAMLVAVIFDIRFAAIVVLALGGIGGYVAGNSLEVAFYLIAGSLMAVFSLRRVDRINGIFRAGIIAGIGNGIVVLAFNASPLIDPVDLAASLGLALANGLLAASLTVGGFYIIGSLFGIITTLQLQELSHLDHPLLKELLRRAPGTYHHSIMVSNLAEQAAERIQANAALVRVGAFYHDIGKMNHPAYFTENQEGINPHDTLDPQSSAAIIIGHVHDGLEMARQYRLPRQVQEFIATHHGNRVLKGFYKKACAQAADPAQVHIERFRYPGPRPTTRETGLVAMADTLEAASSAIQPNNEAAVEKLVNVLIEEIVQEGQLDRSGLTLGDIKAARESFIETLKGRFHVRIRYEGNEQIVAQNTLVAGPTTPPPGAEVRALPAAAEMSSGLIDSAERAAERAADPPLTAPQS